MPSIIINDQNLSQIWSFSLIYSSPWGVLDLYLMCVCLPSITQRAIVSDAIYIGLVSRSGQTKDYKIGILCFPAWAYNI